MKTSHILILTGLVAGIIAFGWQTYAIQQLQAEVAALRKDLRSVLETALEKPTASSSEQDRQRREKLELIKLRNEVRELKEGMVGSHARERMANVRTIVRSVLPIPAMAGGWKIRPEWQGMERDATNQYAQASWSTSNHAASSGAPAMGSWTRGSKTSTQVEFRTLGRT